MGHPEWYLHLLFFFLRKQVPKEFSSQRKNLAIHLSATLKESSRRLAHELIAVHNKKKIDILEKIYNLVFNLLFSHVLEKGVSLDRAVLPSLSLLLECLNEDVIISKFLPSIVPTCLLDMLQDNQRVLDDYFVQCLLKNCKILTPTRLTCLSMILSSNLVASSASMISELDCPYLFLRKIRKFCSVEELISPFPELFEPFLKNLCNV